MSEALRGGDLGLALAEIVKAEADARVGDGPALATETIRLGMALGAYLGQWEAFHDFVRTATREERPLPLAAYEIETLLDCGALDRAEHVIERIAPLAPRAVADPDAATAWASSDAALYRVPAADAARFLAATARYAAYVGSTRAAVVLCGFSHQWLAAAPAECRPAIVLRTSLAEAEALLTFGDLPAARDALDEAGQASVDCDGAEAGRLARLEIDLAWLSGDPGAAADRATATLVLSASAVGSASAALLAEATLDLTDTLSLLNEQTRSAELLGTIAKATRGNLAQQSAARLAAGLERAAHAAGHDMHRSPLPPLSRASWDGADAAGPPMIRDLSQVSARAGAVIGLTQLRRALHAARQARHHAATGDDPSSIPADSADAAIVDAWTALSRVLDRTDAPLLHAMKAEAAAHLSWYDSEMANGVDERAEARERTIDLAHAALDMVPPQGAPLITWRCATLAGQAALAVGQARAAATDFETAEQALDLMLGKLREDPARRRLFLHDKTASAQGLVEARAALCLEPNAGSGAIAALATAAACLRHPGQERRGPSPLAAPAEGVAVLRIVLAGDTGLVAVETSRGGSHVLRTPAPPDDLRALADRLTKDVARHAATLTTDSPLAEIESARLSEMAGLESLAEALGLERLEESLVDDVTTLAVVADDVFAAFPVSAMPLNGVPLIERFAMGMVRERLPNRSPKPRGDGRVFAFGEPVDADGIGTLPALPATVSEAATIAEVTGAQIDRAKSADKRRAALVRALREERLVHVAGHGVFYRDRPSQSGIVVADAAHPQRAKIITLADLIDHEPEIAAREVNLSVCLGADTTLFKDGRAVGLSTTLVEAGVDAVAAFLWPAADAVAARAFDLYAAARRQASPAVALARQARALRRAGTEGQPLLALPAYWANLQLTVADIETLTTSTRHDREFSEQH